MFLVIIDRWYERVSFVPFVGMLVGSCFKLKTVFIAAEMKFARQESHFPSYNYKVT